MREIPPLFLLFSMLAQAQPAALRQLAGERTIKIGAAVNPALLQQADYAETLAREFNQVEPENSLKFGPVHPQQTTYHFDPVDALVAFAKDHQMAVRGHTLVWHKQNPGWVTRGTFTPEQLAAILQEHIQTVVGRYAGRIYAWDVVNEAFDDDGSLRKTIWSGFIEQAFRWAHEADPKALLFYNDYDAEVVNSKSDAIFRMAQDFKARGVPLNGIGLQMHVTLDPGSLENMEANIKRIAELGFEVQITELDVRVPLDSGAATSEQLEKQAQVYHDIVAVCVKYPKCTAIQTWGFTDKYSWIPGAHRGTGAALEFNAAYQPKPAYRAIADALKTR